VILRGFHKKDYHPLPVIDAKTEEKGVFAIDIAH